MGWAAVRTVASGAGVPGARPELSKEQIAVLWIPIEPAIPFDSLEEHVPKPVRARVRAAVARATTAITKPPTPRADSAPAPAKRTSPPKPAAPYGPNSLEVAAFIKGVVELTPIPWLRFLDRRKLVARVTRQNAQPPAPATPFPPASQGTTT